MPNYKRPGVFVQESLTALSQVPSSPGDASGAFVGKVSQGPLTPVRVSSWPQYQAIYGTTFDGGFLSYAVFQYFNNGGRSAWIVRAASSDAVASTITINDRQGSPAANLKVTAESVGAWGNAVYVDVIDNGTTGRFDFQVRLGGTADSNIIERWTDTSMNPVDPRYLLALVNSPVTGSNYVTLANLSTGAYATNKTPVAALATPLVTGADGSAAIDYVGASQQLEQVSDILNLNLPGIVDVTALNSLITWVEAQPDVFLVIDAPQAQTTESATVTSYTAYLPGGGGSALNASSYAAVYGPWLYTDDPSSSTPGATRLLPPGGAVLGRYAATDALRGPQKAPAGIDVPLRGILGAEYAFKNANLDTLNNLGLNVIKVVPGAGYVVWGARTLKSGTPDRYINIRRSLQYVTKSLNDLLSFAVFEPNDSVLWDKISAVASQFLTTQMQSGLLKGNTQAEAFWVKVDADNNPPQQSATGTVVVGIGISLASPAEFVVVQIGLFDGGSTVVTQTA